ncbi:MAG TPA: PA domain-containing protein [Thermoanaerobaculia bacterium]|nr:PA domain-containing protein [Thermoanaerobaculia bacterium]
MRRTIFFAASLLLASNLFAGTGRVTIINADFPGIGFNDETPVAPVGGNPGVTRGQQRFNVYVRAADRWSAALDTNVDIRVRGSFAALQCDDSTAILGQTSVLSWSANFANAPRTEIWYPAALANKFAGSDLTPGQDDMFIQFNSAVDLPTCLGDRSWYYGFDGNEGSDDSLYHVVLHEIAHGLGMSSRALTDFMNRPSVFDLHTLDTTIGLRWDQMSLQQREVSLTNSGNLAWDGENVTEKASQFLGSATIFTVTQPTPVARNYPYGTAAFGPAVGATSLSSRIVPATDDANEAGLTTTDGCTAFTNAAAINGNIALIDRGTCPFVEKAKNAQAAGAIGVIIADNRAACVPPGMAGTAPEVLIPVISISQNDGIALRAQSEEIRGTLRVDPSRLAGSSEQGYVLLYAPCEVSGGSSKHHWDVSASPSLLMEPFINADLQDSLDLSIFQLMDIGWTPPPVRTGRRFLRR